MTIPFMKMIIDNHNTIDNNTRTALIDGAVSQSQYRGRSCKPIKRCLRSDDRFSCPSLRAAHTHDAARSQTCRGHPSMKKVRVPTRFGTYVPSRTSEISYAGRFIADDGNTCGSPVTALSHDSSWPIFHKLTLSVRRRARAGLKTNLKYVPRLPNKYRAL